MLTRVWVGVGGWGEGLRGPQAGGCCLGRRPGPSSPLPMTLGWTTCACHAFYRPMLGSRNSARCARVQVALASVNARIGSATCLGQPKTFASFRLRAAVALNPRPSFEHLGGIAALSCLCLVFARMRQCRKDACQLHAASWRYSAQGSRAQRLHVCCCSPRWSLTSCGAPWGGR